MEIACINDYLFIVICALSQPLSLKDFTHIFQTGHSIIFFKHIQGDQLVKLHSCEIYRKNFANKHVQIFKCYIF